MGLYDSRSYIMLAKPRLLDVMADRTIHFLINDYKPTSPIETKAISLLRSNYVERVARRITVSQRASVNASL